jgi:protoheme IX farnesyltransferase
VTTNRLTALLGAVALLSYVLVYTPLKRVTPWAVLVGGIPGALPPLMGWTAATNTLAPRGWLLFAILFFWQLPHFLAISLYLKDDFKRGGIRVMPLVYGERITRLWLFAFTVMLVGVSLLAEPLGVSSRGYTVTAALIGLAFLGMAGLGLRRGADRVWATRTFGFTLLYLPILISALVLGSL